MAVYTCVDCGFEGHFVEFAVSGAAEREAAYAEDPDEYEDELECPDCGSDAVYESS